MEFRRIGSTCSRAQYQSSLNHTHTQVQNCFYFVERTNAVIMRRNNKGPGNTSISLQGKSRNKNRL